MSMWAAVSENKTEDMRYFSLSETIVLDNYIPTHTHIQKYIPMYACICTHTHIYTCMYLSVVKNLLKKLNNSWTKMCIIQPMQLADFLQTPAIFIFVSCCVCFSLAPSLSELVPDWSQLQQAKTKQADEKYCLSIQDTEIWLSEKDVKAPKCH